MSFLKNKDDSPDKWKDKYFTLLGSQEQVEKAYKANEELLCKTIIRFALAVKGLNKQLDPHLERIRNSLKGGLQSEQLKKELDSFSSILLKLEEEPNKHLAEAGLLFEFLHKQYPLHATQLLELEDKLNRQEFLHSQGLFVALLDLLAEKKSGPGYFALDLPDTEYAIIRTQLLRLLDYAEIPEIFAGEAGQIKTRLQNEANAQVLGAILESTVALLLEVKNYLALEQQEMAEFLSKLTEQLAELALNATGVSIASENAIKKRNLLDQNVSMQMVDLQNKSANATQLEPLKQLVHSRLSDIRLEIHSHLEQEQTEREGLQLELKALTAKVNAMEAESVELKMKLDIAQNNATRDPLTQLPNRLAFEERMRYEMASWRRYGLPLSMVIWDIDFFKKINDNFGHKSGDKALIVISQLLSKHCRQTDFLARFGGEEFIMLLPNTDAQSALGVADKLRVNLEKASFRASGNLISITMSCGISQLLAGDSNESIFERADKALYMAKQNGRNQCVLI